jgi:hypothetical protein
VVARVLQAAVLTITLPTPLIFVRGLNDNFELPKQIAPLAIRRSPEMPIRRRWP